MFNFWNDQGDVAKKTVTRNTGNMSGAAGRVAWSAYDRAGLTRSGFLANPIGYRAVTLIAEALAALPIVLQDNVQRYDTHPFLTLLARPNPTQSRAEFLENLVGQLLLSGDGFVEAQGDEPSALYVLRSDRVRVTTGANGWPDGYEYRVGSRNRRFDARAIACPIFHIRQFHPQNDHYGLSALQAASKAVDVHNAASHWSKALLDNAARPSGAIVYKGAEGQGTLTPKQYERLQSEMEIYHQGARNAGRPMLLEGGLDWKQIGFSPADMEFQKTKEAAAREISVALGVPPMLLGLTGDATYANYQEANRAFYRLSVLPLAQKLFTAIGHWLSQFTGDALQFLVDMDQVPALATEREALWRRVSQADFLDDNEKRSLLGLPKQQL